MADNNYLISILIFITIYLLNIPTAFSINDNELHHICLPNNKNFTSSYNGSRALLVFDVIVNTASQQGFRAASHKLYKDNEGPVYGLALCRGDVSPDDCRACVTNASITLISTHCLDSRSAIIWREYCMFKYSDVNFFVIVDTNSSSMYNTTGDTWEGDGIQFVIVEYLVRESLIQIVINRSQNLYGEANLTTSGNTDSVTLYGMAQCTRDLVTAKCTECLDQALTDLKEMNFSRYKGVRMLYGSCILGYEIYPFLN